MKFVQALSRDSGLVFKRGFVQGMTQSLLQRQPSIAIANPLESILSNSSNHLHSTVKRIGMLLTVCVCQFSVTSHVVQAATPPGVNSANTTIPVDMSSVTITKHELALMQVLSEICPPMLNNTQKQRFYRGYNAQLKYLLPTLDNPTAAMQYLSTQQDYRQILQSIRQWTMQFAQSDNQALCEDLANASF